MIQHVMTSTSVGGYEAISGRSVDRVAFFVDGMCRVVDVRRETRRVLSGQLVVAVRCFKF